MRADRLMAILLHLQANGQATAGELAEKLEVSERTIRRDLDALCASGIPLYAVRGVQGGWRLTEGYRSKLTGLTSGEIRALLLLHSSSVVKDLALAEETGSAIGKLLAALPTDKRTEAEFVRRHLHIDGAGWHEPRRPSPWLPIVQQAVWEGRRLRIRYAASAPDARETERLVSPWGLVAKRQTWYFVALTEPPEGAEGGEGIASADTDERLRTYRVSRVLEAELTETRFETPPEFDLAAWWERSTQSFKERLPSYIAKIKVREEAWDRLRNDRYVNVRSVHSSEDGWREADVDLQTPDYARDLLLGYGPLALVLEPAELRLAIIRAASDTLKAYGGG